MDQDELEEEVFTKTIVDHLGLVSKFVVNSNWQTLLYCRETFCAVAVVVALAVWLVHSSRNSFGFFWTAIPMAGIAGLEGSGSDVEEQLGESAVYALKGRRSTMEDRFVMIHIQPDFGSGPPVVLHAVLDGHGGEYAVNYVKQHLIANLVRKIRLLKILTNSLAKSLDKIRLYEKISGESVTKSVLDYLEVSLSEYKDINPKGKLFAEAEEPKKEDLPSKQVSIGANLVLSNRIKSLEELPNISPPKSVSGNGVESMCDNMLSPYNNVPNAKDKQRLKSRSPAINETDSSKPKEILDYLNPKGEITYSDLIRDEISAVDLLLVKDSKKAGQIGGTTLLMTILDARSFWVANVGDSRGVLCNSRGDTIPLSYDHKPCLLKEKKRIQEAGGFVSMNGVWRVQGVLATSRALGDYPLKDRKVVVSEPDVLSFHLSAEPHLRPDFAILASDGLWDTFSNEDAVSFVRRHLFSFGGSKSELTAAKCLAKEAFSKGSTDNVTVMVINFRKMFLAKSVATNT